MITKLKYIFIVVGLLYFLFPRDLIPDFGLIGRLDDLLVLGLLYWRYRRSKNISDLMEELKTEWARRKQEKGAGAATEERRDRPDAHTVLGVQRDASRDEVQKAYRALLAKYHPDKVHHLGREFQDLAHEKVLQIKRAYEELTGAQAT